jgi:glycosyltransferase involved in cell wall biosynthesis
LIQPFSRKRKRPSIITLADRARDSGQWELAAHLYRKALDRNPQNPPICIQYGHVLKERGDLRQAEGAYRAAIRLEPANPDSHLQLGRVLKLQGKMEEAQASYLRAFTLAPSLPYALHELSGLGWSRAQVAALRELLANGSPSAAENGRSLPPSDADKDEAVTEEDWSSRFDAEWYAKRNPDVARSGMDPLEHFLRHGLKEGRKPNAAEAREVWKADPIGTKSGYRLATDAEIYCLIKPSFAHEVALFVAHSPHGHLKPHVPHYLNSLRRQGIAVVVIVAADTPFMDVDTESMRAVDGLFVRQNEGYDFAAWAHILHLHPELFDANILYLLNDSLFGPTNDILFRDLLDRVRTTPADIIGLTDNFERGWHVSSYFLALKSRALSSTVTHKFFNEIVSYRDKEDVINQFEIRFAPILRAAGLSCEAMFRATDSLSPTIFHWRDLLQSGFPFIKVMAVRDAFPGADMNGWRELLAAQGYDVTLADRTLAEAKTPSDPKRPSARSGKLPLLPHGLAPVASPEIKVAFIGPWNYNNGLGVASRGYISALRHTRLMTNFHPIRKPLHIHQRLAPAVDICDFSGTADVAIVHYNPDGWHGLLTESQRQIIDRAKLKIGLWVWEMASIPTSWFPNFDEVEAIWTPSHYCAEIFAARARVPVDVVPHVIANTFSVFDPARTIVMRQELGLSEENRIILYAFDGSSYLIRKNPFALIRAFSQSQLAKKGWRLVLKVKNLYDRPAEGIRLGREVERAEGVILVDRAVDEAAMGEFMRAADIYASPHCSEGFGLTIAEAMALGKIVVATDYGGSRDLLDAECGFPVRYTLRSLDDDYGHYRREGGLWAQIDETHLSESLIEASELVMAGDFRLGDAARSRVRDRLSPSAVGAKMHESISRLTGFCKR